MGIIYGQKSFNQSLNASYNIFLYDTLLKKLCMKKEYIVLLIGCIIGTLFRLWFINTTPQPFQFDQWEYYYFAVQMLKNGIFASTARLYGYPLFQVIIYKIHSIYSIQPVFVYQAIVDSLTAFLIYKWAKLLFRQKSVPWVAFALYLFNPYTSAYVGVILSEVLGTFFTTLMLYLLTLFVLKKNPYVLLLLSITAGFLTQIRPAFLYFAIGSFIFCLYLFFKETIKTKLRMLLLIEAIVLFVLPFLYTLWGNVLYFQEWTFTNVDHIPPRELYISVMVPNRAPYHQSNGFAAYPPEVMHLYREYSSPTNQKERALMGDKYFNLSKTVIINDPWLFVRQRLGKMFFVWEKHYLFYYQEPINQLRDVLVYWGNIILLVLGVSGLIMWCWKEKKQSKKFILLAGVYAIFLVYISVIHSVSLAEERYSLPGYPLLFLFAGYAIVFLWLHDS